MKTAANQRLKWTAPTATLDDLELFVNFAHQTPRASQQLVERHMGLATHIAKRYSHAGRRDDDLRQVAMIGLVKWSTGSTRNTVWRSRRSPGRTIEGELKRHFRDASWAVKVPRRAKELHLLVRNAADRTGKD